MRLAVLVLACVSCGRVGFDSPRMDRIDASTARPDAVVIESVCPLAQVGSTVTYAGQTFQYTGFNNQTGAVPDVLVTARDGGTAISQTTSDASGNYALTIPTNNTAHFIEVDYETSGYWETRVLSDRPLDADVVSPNMDRYRLGDGERLQREPEPVRSCEGHAQHRGA